MTVYKSENGAGKDAGLQGERKMNFRKNKTTQRIAAVIIGILVVAMLLAPILSSIR